MGTDDLEVLVARAAELNTHGQNDILYRALLGRSVFVNVNWKDVTDPETGEVRSRPHSSPLLRLPSGQHALMVYTSPDDSHLVRPFAGSPWEKLLLQVTKMPNADGLILNNLRGDKVAIDKSRIQRLLEEQSSAETPK